MDRWARFVGQTVVAVATGGLAYNGDASALVNLLHLYAWLALFIVPFAISMVRPPRRAGRRC